MCYFPLPPIPLEKGDIIGLVDDGTPQVRIVYVIRKGRTIWSEA